MKDDWFGWSSMSSSLKRLRLPSIVGAMVTRLKKCFHLICVVSILCLSVAVLSSLEPAYARIPKGFKRLQFDHPFMWEIWMNSPGAESEIWRSTASIASAQSRMKMIMERAKLDAIHFKKIRTRTGKAGFGGTLENYSVGYFDDPKGPRESLAIWKATKNGYQRVIVTQYPINQSKRWAQIMTNQIAAESKAFLESR